MLAKSQIILSWNKQLISLTAGPLKGLINKLYLNKFPCASYMQPSQKELWAQSYLVLGWQWTKLTFSAGPDVLDNISLVLAEGLLACFAYHSIFFSLISSGLGLKMKVRRKARSLVIFTLRPRAAPSLWHPPNQILFIWYHNLTQETMSYTYSK